MALPNERDDAFHGFHGFTHLIKVNTTAKRYTIGVTKVRSPYYVPYVPYPTKYS